MRQPEGGCISGFFATELEHCLLGKAGGETNIIAVGDSHMHQWADVFDEIAKNNEISIELIAKSACAVPDISEYFYGRLGRNYTECNIWRQSLIEYLQSTKPSLLVIQVSSMGYINSEITLQDWTAGLRRFLKQLSNDVNVLWILDNPRFPFDPRRCISEQIIREAQSIDCSTRRSLAISAELQDAEVSVLNEFGAKVLDLTEFFCSETQCYSFINDMPVMSDTNHVTQGFLRSLMSEVEQHLILR